MARGKVKPAAASEPVEGQWTLPAGWRWERLGDHVSRAGASITPARSPDKDFQLYSVPSFSIGRPETLKGRSIASSKQSVSAGDVLLCKINPRINRVWKVSDFETGTLIASTEWIRFAASHSMNPDYLRYFMMRKEVRDYLAMNVSGVGGSLMRVRPSTVDPVPFPCAPRNAQDRIVDCIDELFAEVEDGEAALERARGDLATWRKALLKAAVTGELTADWRAANPPTETGAVLLARILAERRTRWVADPRNRGRRYIEPAAPANDRLAALPSGWAQATVEQVAFVENGQTPKGIETIVSSKGEVPWFKVSSMNAEGNLDRLTSSNWRLNKTQAKDIGLRVHPTDTIVFPKRGGSIFTEKKRRLGCPAAIDLNVMGVVPTELITEYLWTFFQGVSLTSISDGSNVPQINYDDVSTLIVPLPPHGEARAIAALVRDAMQAIHLTEAELQAQAEASTTLRQSILAAAFRGDLVA